MPVQAADFHVLGGVLPFAEAPRDDRQINHADGDVQHVQAGKAKERAAEKRSSRIEGVRPRRDAFTEERDPLRGVNRDEERCRKRWWRSGSARFSCGRR